jgi:hypothetical protein
MLPSPLLAYYEFSKPDAHAVPHVTADLAFKPQRLLLRRLGKLALQWVFLSAVSALFAFVSTLTFS